MKRLFFATLSCLALLPADAAIADQWGSRVMAECYDNLTGSHREHMFVRVFRTELGGGQLDAPDGQTTGVFSLEQPDQRPFSYIVDGKTARFELLEYRSPRETGACARCEFAAFRLLVDGEVIWEVTPPLSVGESIFNGTVDLDREMARICTVEGMPEQTEDYFAPQTSMLICRTIAYELTRCLLWSRSRLLKVRNTRDAPNLGMARRWWIWALCGATSYADVLQTDVTNTLAGAVGRRPASFFLKSGPEDNGFIADEIGSHGADNRAGQAGGVTTASAQPMRSSRADL